MAYAHSEQVLAANAAFYAAMRAGDFAAMEMLWSVRHPVSCTHPGRAMLMGHEAVMQSWREILSGLHLDIECDDPVAAGTAGSMMVLCVERIGPHRLMASNSFLLEDGVWRMTGHHASEMPG